MPRARQLAREVPGARLVLVQHQEADVPAPLLQSRQQREQMRLGARDPGHLLQVEDGSNLTHCAAARIPSAHVSTECRSCHALAQRSPDLGTFAFVEPGEPAETVGKALRRVALEEQRIAVEQLVEHRIGREHRQARRRSFVHDLVGRSRLHVVDEEIRPREQLRNLRAWHRVAERDHRAARARCDVAARARSARRRASGRRRLRPARRHGGSSRSPWPANSARAPTPGRRCARVRSVQANSFTSIPCPIGRTLGEASGNERAVDAHDRRREPLCRTQCRGRLPVRVPEQQAAFAAGARSARRAGRRRESCARRPRPPAAHARARARTARHAAHEMVHRTSAPRRSPGSPSPSPDCARTTTSSTRSASARIFGIVAASTGCPGSTLCVRKTSRRIGRRSPCRRA